MVAGGATGADSAATAEGRGFWKGVAPRALALSGAAVLAIVGAEVMWSGGETATAAVALPSAGFGPDNFDQELAASDRQLALARERVANAPDQWLPREGLARAELARFKMTADPERLALARNNLAMAQDLAPAASGPILTAAEIAMAGHDLAAAEMQLDRLEKVAVAPSPAERAEAVALRGDIEFYRGNMAGAASAYTAADAILPTSGTAIRQALLARSQGRFDEAIELVGKAARRDSLRTPRGLASYALQIGMIESARGNFEAAAERFWQADRLFPGHWLTQLYIAEAQGVAGDFDDAIAVQERIAREYGDPQALDAAASLYLAQGDTQAADQLTQRSTAIWRARAKAMPLAYTAHTFENELAFGDPQRALRLARENLSHRPYGDAHILVAEALLETGDPAQARAHLLEAEAQGWRSAPLYARLSEAEEMLGNDKASKAAAKKARELNPSIFDPVMSRLWFGHG
ncbi:tetratricopeptide repeat protein [Aurantiacibacter rhizosphaerae]|uniref:Tetratricopeptide repeat protein n=1 Tax=Aurantiacibacter rhizosphaerae TaxID=2691582 RepID=A0A844XAQ4_9SPHN|nr:tetratricopeptide repeat protein [Aurantiacibacter rhizosphaerae]MWV27561.1 tetratricopeptide repeat protein [Aurantiacibacter rhizosphaerae]